MNNSLSKHCFHDMINLAQIFKTKQVDNLSNARELGKLQDKKYVDSKVAKENL